MVCACVTLFKYFGVLNCDLELLIVIVQYLGFGFTFALLLVLCLNVGWFCCVSCLCFYSFINYVWVHVVGCLFFVGCASLVCLFLAVWFDCFCWCCYCDLLSLILRFCGVYCFGCFVTTLWLRWSVSYFTVVVAAKFCFGLVCLIICVYAFTLNCC